MVSTAIILKEFTREPFGKVITALVVGLNICNHNATIFATILANMAPEVVLLNMEILGATGDALIVCKANSTMIVFKDSCRHRGLEI